MESTLLAFGLLAAAFAPLEKAFAERKQPFFRVGWGTDLGFFLGQYLLWSGLLLWVMSHTASVLALLPTDPVRTAVSKLPWLLQATVVLVLGDLLVYWWHRLSHQVPLLWRFHRVHHTAPRLDWLAAYREHPIDSLCTHFWANLPAFLLGISTGSIAGIIMFRGLWAIFIHSNVRIPLGPFQVLLGSPHLHHSHHDINDGRANFANLFPLLDVVFGTYHNPDHPPSAYGVTEPSPHRYLPLLLEPFGLWPARFWRKP